MSPSEDERHDQFLRLLPANEPAIRAHARLLLSTLAGRFGLDQPGENDQSLPHADGWNRDYYRLNHRGFNDAATMRLGMSGDLLAPGSNESQDYPESRTPDPADQWCGVNWAKVCDATRRNGRFYHNGRLKKEARRSTAYPVGLRSIQIGASNQEGCKLSERIDGMVIPGHPHPQIQ